MKLSRSWRAALQKCVRTELFALFCAQLSTYMIPILMIPLLARRLGPQGWGVVASFQSAALCLALVVEYGFSLSETRRVARNRESREYRSGALAAVWAAKVLLGGGVIAFGLLLAATLQLCREHPWILAGALAMALAQGSSLLWYFQGLGRTSVAAVAEGGGRAAAALLMVILVQGPSDAWMPVWLWALGSAAAGVIMTIRAYRDVPFQRPTPGSGFRALREGFPMFLFRSAISLYALGNAFILGNIAGPHVVAYYAGAERIGRGALAFLHPLVMDMNAQVNHAMARSAREAAIVHLRFSRALLGGGVLIGILLFASAGPVVRFMLGPGFEPTVTALRLFALLPPVVAVSNALGSNWMVPLHADGPSTLIVIVASILNLVLALLLAPRLQHLGMCIAVLSTEVFVSTSYFAWLRARRCDPFTIVRRGTQGACPAAPLAIPGAAD